MSPDKTDVFLLFKNAFNVVKSLILPRIQPLDEFPDFRDWLKQALLSGYGIGEREPWTRYAREGYA